MLLTMTFGTVIYAFISFRDTAVLLIAGVIIVYGFGTWFLGHKLAPVLSKIFFSIQKRSLFHLMPSFKIIENEEYFLTQTAKSPLESLFLLWIGSWALVVSLAHNLATPIGFIGMINFDNFPFSEDFEELVLAWLLTPLVAFIVFPISIIESSNVRVFLKAKNIVTSPSRPFRYIVGGFATIGILTTILQGLNLTELLVAILIFAAPFYLMTFLYKIKSEEKLTRNFRLYLEKIGIKEKEINPQ